MSSNVQIRYAKKEDLPSVYALVQQLAEFENAPKAVTSSLSDYKQAFESSLVGIVLAEQDTKIIGMALYYDTFSTWKGKMLYLEDFIVESQYRNQGIGKLLFDAVVEEAHRRKCTMMKWQVLDWNTSAIRFYKKYNTTFDKEWIDCKLYFNNSK